MTEQEALARLLPVNPSKPHRAVIFLSAEVHEITANNECCGSPTYKVESFPVFLDGADRGIAIRQLNELLAGMKERSEKWR